MVTTAIFAELIVGGLEAEAWILLLVLAIFSTKAIPFRDAHDWVALITLLVIAAAYVLGVIVDRVADTFLVRLLSAALRPRPIDKPANIDRMRIALLSKDDATARFLDYQRSRMRVARATVFNLTVLWPVLLLFLIRQTDASTPNILVVALVAFAAVIVAAAVYRGIDFAYVCRLSDAYRLAEGLPEADIAAAVCYRWNGKELEFAIVQTKDGKLWTFPKGHRKRRETLPEAARREAREEAGIEGKMIGNRLCTYRYPPTRPGRREDDWIAAFLLKVDRAGPADEARKLRWCKFEEARTALADGRTSCHAKGMEDAMIAGEEALEMND